MTTVLFFYCFPQVTARTRPVFRQLLWSPVQFYHRWACLFLGKVVFCKLWIPEKDLAFATLPSWNKPPWSLTVFASFSCLIFFQGYTSYAQQLGHTAKMLTRKPKDIPGRGLEAFLPKSFHWPRPGSCDIGHHGKSNLAISQNWCFPVWILRRTKMICPILGPQQQQPILVKCSWGPWRGENRQLQPGTAAEWWLCQRLVRDKDSSVFGLSIPQLPLLPYHQELQLPNVPDCVSEYAILCSTVNKIAGEPAVFQLLRC